MIKYKWMTYGVVLLLALAAVVVAFKSNDKSRADLLPIELAIFETSAGWGYEITVDHKPFIRQATMPAVAGNKAFATRRDALLVGNLGVEKLKKGKMPEITLEDLKQLGIIAAALPQTANISVTK